LKPAVLIIDDSLTVRMDLGEALQAAGLPSTCSPTLSEARKALATGVFALVILDVLLPDGDGIDFLQEIRTSSATAKTPVMLLSSESEVSDRVLGLKTGADEYVGKPYDLSYVVARSLELMRTAEKSEEGRSTTILLIDDSPTFREELKSAFESYGHSVITAGTGEDGLRLAVDARPAVIVVDGVLPGIDGATVIRRIRDDAALRGTPCILLTASGERSGELKAFDAGADAYVRKGDDTAIILTRVNAVLRSAKAPSAVGPTSSLLGPKRILIVDDSLTYLEEIAEQLRQKGYDVIPARSGEEALALLAVQSVDCVLLDLVMPGLSGQETCQRIKKTPAWRDIPLIMHTSLEEKDAMIEGINEGADDFIAKSSDLEVLQARIKAQLRRRQFEEENHNIRERLLQKELEITAANSARELAETRAAFVEELEHKNAELEAFCYSASHDLRTPLNAIQGFSQLVLEDHADNLDAKGKDYLRRVCAGTQRMAHLIDDLLLLSRVSRSDLNRDRTDLSRIVRSVAEELQRSDPNRQSSIDVEDELVVEADHHLMRVAFENLLGNAWKYTSKVPTSRIEVGIKKSEGASAFFVRDNGAGFDMRHADKLFRPFQRLHPDSEFSGTGIGLATVYRIIERHGGNIWAESVVGHGATFYFTIPTAKSETLALDIGRKTERKLGSRSAADKAVVAPVGTSPRPGNC
jgi:two-component system, NtrC family, sensor kinase